MRLEVRKFLKRPRNASFIFHLLFSVEPEPWLPDWFSFVCL
jgi:hypothetical protein